MGTPAQWEDGDTRCQGRHFVSADGERRRARLGPQSQRHVQRPSAPAARPPSRRETPPPMNAARRTATCRQSRRSSPPRSRWPRPTPARTSADSSRANSGCAKRTGSLFMTRGAANAAGSTGAPVRQSIEFSGHRAAACAAAAARSQAVRRSAVYTPSRTAASSCASTLRIAARSTGRPVAPVIAPAGCAARTAVAPPPAPRCRRGCPVAGAQSSSCGQRRWSGTSSGV